MKQFSEFPVDLRLVHDTVRKYRNTAVAHSQSDLVMPIVLALLDDHGAVRDVIGVTLIHPMPLAVAERFAELVDAVEVMVDAALQVIGEGLKSKLADVPPEVVAAWPLPERAAADVKSS